MSESVLPKGFLLSTASAAIKKPGRADIALIYSERDANAAGVFTKNRIKGAPVKLCMERIRSGRGRAIIANSGNSNACTGPKGVKDAGETARAVAGCLGIEERLVYVSSTGVIGSPLPMKRILPAIPRLCSGLGKASLKDAASAIMTTDTFPKHSSKTVQIGRLGGTVSGISKGAGMICPDMATMLSFIITDIAVEKTALGKALRESVQKSFNRITVDGDMSTSDTVIILSNGALGNPEIKAGGRRYEAFRKALDALTFEMARMVAGDGEGATKLITVAVKGAKTRAEAKKGAFSVANSNLFKTAMYGMDANWGRIMAALGSSGINIREERTDIYFGRVKAVRNGVSTGRDTEAGKTLRGKEIKVTIDLKAGDSSYEVLTCDISPQYVSINAEYRT